MVNVYRHFLAHPELPSGTYNAGFENISIRDNIVGFIGLYVRDSFSSID
jgi:hypothetical protein